VPDFIGKYLCQAPKKVAEKTFEYRTRGNTGKNGTAVARNPSPGFICLYLRETTNSLLKVFLQKANHFPSMKPDLTSEVFGTIRPQKNARKRSR
jgi:hypothetical protein